MNWKPKAIYTETSVPGGILAKISTTSLSELNLLLPDVWKADSLSQSPNGAPITASQTNLAE